MDDLEIISSTEQLSNFDSRESICRSRTGTIKKQELSIEEARELADKKRRKKLRNCMGYIIVFLLATAGILVPIIVAATRKPPLYVVTYLSTSKPITTTGQTRITTTVLTTTITPIDTCERNFVALSGNLNALVSSLVIVDLNRDNKSDIVFICETQQRVWIIYNLGNNNFGDQKDQLIKNTVSYVTAADIDDDNDFDVIVGCAYSSSTVQILFNDGTGLFHGTTNLVSDSVNPVSSIVVIDINNDGKSDIIISIAEANMVGIYLNKGNGTFDDIKIYSMDNFPMSVYATDLDNDNKFDLIVANTKSNKISVLYNQGDGTFSDPINYSFGIGPIFVTSTDLNHDNQSDIILVNYFSNNVVIYLNNGNRNFIHYTNFTAQANPLSIALNDYNSDGSIDIIVPNYHSNTIQVFFNDGTGIFSQSTAYITYPNPRAVDVGDLNDDNKPDIVFGNGNYVGVILTRCDL